jgi:hypothetical protein
MAGPSIALYDSTHTNLVSTWAVGTVKAQTPSAVLTVNIWNNKGGTVDLSDLKDCTIAVYDSTGNTANDDVAKDKWVEINVPSVDGTTTTWTAIGGTTVKSIRANGSTTDFSISGAKNDGTETGATTNFSTVNLRINAPINSVPGSKSFKVRLTGYYT